MPRALRPVGAHRVVEVERDVPQRGPGVAVAVADQEAVPHLQILASRDDAQPAPADARHADQQLVEHSVVGAVHAVVVGRGRGHGRAAGAQPQALRQSIVQPQAGEALAPGVVRPRVTRRERDAPVRSEVGVVHEVVRSGRFGAEGEPRRHHATRVRPGPLRGARRPGGERQQRATDPKPRRPAHSLDDPSGFHRHPPHGAALIWSQTRVYFALSAPRSRITSHLACTAGSSFTAGLFRNSPGSFG